MTARQMGTGTSSHMIVARSPSKARPVKPASRAVAIRYRRRHWRSASVPARAQTGSHAGIPMIRDAEIEQLLRDYTAPILQSRRARQSERPGRHHQRQILQRLRDGCAPHLRQYRRADGGHHAQSDDRRVRPRDRPHRRRPSVEDAPGTRQCADRDDHRHAARRRRHGGRRAFRQHRHGQCRRRRVHRAAGAGDELAVVLSARPGGIGRPRRRAFSHHDRPVGQGHVRHLQAIRRRFAVLGAWRQSLCAEPSDAARAHGRARGTGEDAVLGQEGSAGTAIPPRHDAGEALRLHRTARRGAATLSADRYQPAGALRARHLRLPFRRSAQRHRADRRLDRRRCRTIPISTSSRARRCSKAGIRPRRSRRCATPSSSRPIPP